MSSGVIPERSVPSDGKPVLRSVSEWCFGIWVLTVVLVYVLLFVSPSLLIEQSEVLRSVHAALFKFFSGMPPG